MSGQIDLRGLAVQTLTDPAGTARWLMSLHLARGTLWTALLLVVVLNTLIFTLSNMLVPTPEGAAAPLPAVLANPAVYFVSVGLGLVATIYAIQWVGRGLGGTGSVEDVMVLMVWLQALRVVVQAAALVLLLLVPVLSAILVFAALVVGFWILLHFINEAHGLGSLWRAAGVLLAAVLALVLALSLVLSLVGGPMTGGQSVV